MTHVGVDQGSTSDFRPDDSDVPGELQQAGSGSSGEPESGSGTNGQASCPTIRKTLVSLFPEIPTEEVDALDRLWCKARPHLLLFYQRLMKHAQGSGTNST